MATSPYPDNHEHGTLKVYKSNNSHQDLILITVEYIIYRLGHKNGSIFRGANFQIAQTKFHKNSLNII